MSDQAHVKTLAEKERFGRFINAYEVVTGVSLAIIDSGDRPQFRTKWGQSDTAETC